MQGIVGMQGCEYNQQHSYLSIDRTHKYIYVVIFFLYSFALVIYSSSAGFTFMILSSIYQLHIKYTVFGFKSLYKTIQIIIKLREFSMRCPL